MRVRLLVLMQVFAMAVLMTLSGQAMAATGGTLLVTSSSDTVAAGQTIDVTVAVTANTASRINSAGIVLQWDKNVFALDASSAGTTGDNDPHATSYLDGETGAFQANANANSRITHVWTVGATDLMQLRISDSDSAADALSGVQGQAYVNYTRLAAIGTSTGPTLSNSQFFTVKLLAKAGATAGASDIKAKFIAVSDNQASTAASYTQATKSVTVSVPSISLTAGDAQSASVGAAIGTALKVTLATGTTANAGVTVTFTASGATFAGGSATATATTDASGVATAPTLTMGTTPGAVTVTAAATGYTTKTFNLTAAVGAAGSITKTSGDSPTQSATVGTALTTPFTVTVKDSYGNTLGAGTNVTFAVASGGGSLSATTVATNANGQASTTLTLGTTAGSNTVTASVTGATAVTFTATGVAGTATQMTLAASSSTVSAYTSTPVTLTATLKDANGNTATTNTSVVTFTVDAATYGYFGAAGVATIQATAVAGVATTTLTSVALATTDVTSHAISVGASSGAITATNTTVTLAPFSLSPTTANLLVGESKAFTVTGGTASTAWTHSNATAGTFSATTGATSTYTAGTAAATDTITVTGTSTTSQATVNIYTAVSTSVTAATGLVIGQTMPVIATGGTGNYTCASSNTAVATVTAIATNSTCTVTPVAAGTVTITVTDGTAAAATAYSGATQTNSKATSTIEVISPITVTSTKAADGKVYLDTATNKSYTVTATGGKASGEYTYTSGTTSVATVSSAGVVTAVATGTSVITITDKTYSNVTQTLTVVVMGPITIKDSVAATEIVTTQSVMSGGPGMRFKLSGGSTNYTVAYAKTGVQGSTTLTACAQADATQGKCVLGEYIFNAPTTGAFAGAYTITVTDTTANLTKTLTVNVPYKIVPAKISNLKFVPALNILSNDTSAFMAVTGGAAGDIFKLTVLDQNGTADSTGKLAGLAAAAAGVGNATLNATAASDANNPGHPAVGYLIPVSTLTSPTFVKVKAVLQTNNTDSTEAWASVTSGMVSILPMATYTLTVNDSAGAAVAGATVSFRQQSEVSNKYGVNAVIAATDATGKTTVSLPAGMKYDFDVMPSNASTHQPGVISVASGTTTGTATLQAIASGTLSTYNGSISVAGRCAGKAATTKAACDTAGGTWGTGIQTPLITAVDANNKEVKINVTSAGSCTVAGNTTLPTCAAAGGTWTQPFTLNVSAASFTPVKFIATAVGAKAAFKPTSTEPLPTSACSDATKLTYTTCLAVAGNTWQATFASAFTLLDQPPSDTTTLAGVQSTSVQAMNNATVANSMALGAVNTTYNEVSKTFTLPALTNFAPAGTTVSGANTVAVPRPRATETGAPAASNILNVVGYDPAIVILKDSNGAIISAPVVPQPFSDAQAAKISGGTAQMGSGGTLPIVLGAEKQSFDLTKQSDGATASNVSNITSVGLKIPTQAFKDSTVSIFSTVRAAKLDDAAVAASSVFSKGNLTGGEIVEIDLVALDSNGNALSTSSGNTNITTAIPVTIPLSRTAVVSSSNLVVYTAPTMQDFLDGTNVTTLTDVSYDANTFEVTVNVTHFSVFVPGVAAAAASTAGGGGGCFIATAAYGSYEAPYVKLLREFRDQYLLTNAPGSWFVDQYYTYSPSMADWLRGHDGWRAVVRVALLPLIGMSWLLIHGSMPMQIALLASLVLIPVGILRFRRRRLVQA